MASNFLLISILWILTQVSYAGGAQEYVVAARFCVTSDAAKSKCEAMKTAFDSANLRQLSCIQAANPYACMRKVKAGEADILKADDTDIFAAGKFYDLVPILKESSVTDPNAETFLYKGVIIVRANTDINSLNDLKLLKKKSCHTGVGKTVGWTVPVSNLQALGVMDVTDCDNTVKNVADFFSQSCAPGAYSAVNNIDGDNPANVCQLCDSDRCPATDRYSGYSGAVQCLIDGRGDVAFAKHSTLDSLAQQNPAINKNDFLLLCPDGTKKHVDEWSTCNWATRPTDVIMTSPTLPQQTINEIRTLFQQGAMRFNESNPTFKMFSSDGYTGDDVLFTDGTKKLRGVTSTNYSSYLGSGYLNTMTNYQNCSSTDRWCVISDTEYNKCMEMAAAFASARFTSKVGCVRANSHAECMGLIKNDTADLVTLDGGDVYTAGKYHDLVPIASESYGQSGSTSYWAVAVVRKTNAGVNINNLKGKTSCHTGIQKTSGWIIPVGTLVETGKMTVADKRCGLGKAVGAFFSKSCVPGALDPKYNPVGTNPDNLCNLCGGKDKCQRDNSNIYYGYKGAFRCLIEKNADVAFIKHSTVGDNTDGKNTEEWARNLISSDFELLCSDGTRKAVDQWQSCNLARVPAHAVVTSSKKTPADRKHYVTILKKGVLKFGPTGTGFNMFATNEGHDALFDDTTTSMSDIMADMQNYRKWLGDDYAGAVDALDAGTCTSGQTTLSAISGLVSLLTLALLCL